MSSYIATQHIGILEAKLNKIKFFYLLYHLDFPLVIYAGIPLLHAVQERRVHADRMNMR